MSLLSYLMNYSINLLYSNVLCVPRNWKKIINVYWILGPVILSVFKISLFNTSSCVCPDALAACNYLPQSREKIIAALFKALNSTNSELQEAGEACMRKVSPLPPPASFPFFNLSVFSALSSSALLPLMSPAWKDQYRMEWNRLRGKWIWPWCIVSLRKAGMAFLLRWSRVFLLLWVDRTVVKNRVLRCYYHVVSLVGHVKAAVSIKHSMAV